MRFAEALGAPRPALEQLGVATTLFWAAADVADDIDDAAPGAGGGALTANDVCALLLLAQRAFLNLSPEVASETVEYVVSSVGP